MGRPTPYRRHPGPGERVSQSLLTEKRQLSSGGRRWLTAAPKRRGLVTGSKQSWRGKDIPRVHETPSAENRAGQTCIIAYSHWRPQAKVEDIEKSVGEEQEAEARAAEKGGQDVIRRDMHSTRAPVSQPTTLSPCLVCMSLDSLVNLSTHYESHGDDSRGLRPAQDGRLGTSATTLICTLCMVVPG
ncbi:hypothetical protein CSOJ01_07216 [Colletotrichum sojae]|uniref:Uncharacterized protein n=1 Tax=Colletotrichum sojae TaxID=2175907 RepID=A0A8H6JA69_9PEZI|nr:hypothetical protein CSOJ01_07216 [Colletotrichum sojae]